MAKLLELTTMEYQLLALFAVNPGKTYTRDEILNELRGIDAQLFSRSVDILVSRLRQKLGDTSKAGAFHQDRLGHRLCVCRPGG